MLPGFLCSCDSGATSRRKCQGSVDECRDIGGVTHLLKLCMCRDDYDRLARKDCSAKNIVCLNGGICVNNSWTLVLEVMLKSNQPSVSPKTLQDIINAMAKMSKMAMTGDSFHSTF